MVVVVIEVLLLPLAAAIVDVDPEGVDLHLVPPLSRKRNDPAYAS